MVLSRLLAFIRPAFVTEQMLEPRMTEAEVLAVVALAVGPCPPGQELHWATLRQVEGRLVWTVSTLTMGPSAAVCVDDATGVVGPLTRHGLC